jgi:hypothetical protein
MFAKDFSKKYFPVYPGWGVVAVGHRPPLAEQHWI